MKREVILGYRGARELFDCLEKNPAPVYCPVQISPDYYRPKDLKVEIIKRRKMRRG